MFNSASSSSSEDGEESRTPFNAVSAAAAAQRQRLSRRNRVSRARGAPGDGEAFEYDEALEAANREQRTAPKRERKSRYIGKLVEQVARRKDDMERVQERRLIKEREEEDHLYKDKEQFVTKAYIRQMEERVENDREDAEEEERWKTGQTNVSKFAMRIRGGESSGVEEEIVFDEQDAVHTSRGDGKSEQGSPAIKLIRESEVCTTAEKTRVVEKDNANLLPDNDNASLEPERKSTRAEEEKDIDDSVQQNQKRKPKRGLRRNDEKAIEAYRQRYFQRQAKKNG